jgi:hypothetical protein
MDTRTNQPTTNQEDAMRSAELMPTKKQFSDLDKRLVRAGWTLSHSVMPDSGRSGGMFGSCYLRKDSALYVNYLTFELINLTLDSQGF